jgi:copper(I)-binding protein
MTAFRNSLIVSAVTLSAVTCGALTAGDPSGRYQVGKVAVEQPWARETAAGQQVGGGFMIISNRGKTADRLISASSPVANEVQLHNMTMDGGIMRMRQVEGGIAIPANGRLELKPGSYHIMFMGLKRPLRQGERFAVTLRFKQAGQLTVRFTVQPVGAAGPKGGSHGGQ